ncbi:hypothetical protein J9303_00820 [Bacillaceae bacterium Marseille-Q3522]|nr:hypothetical protein [Bacillaceae bacterium Marseille-Q3522]
MIGLLKKALLNGTILEMIYLDKKGRLSQRKIKVQSIGNDSFTAYCYSRRQQRIFKIENVLSIDLVRTRKTAS